MFSGQYFLQMLVTFYVITLRFFSSADHLSATDQKEFGLMLSYGHQCQLILSLVNVVYALCALLFVPNLACHSCSRNYY